MEMLQKSVFDTKNDILRFCGLFYLIDYTVQASMRSAEKKKYQKSF